MIHQYAFQTYRDSDLLHYEVLVLISNVISTTFPWFDSVPSVTSRW